MQQSSVSALKQRSASEPQNPPLQADVGRERPWLVRAPELP